MAKRTDNFTSPENTNEETLLYTCDICENVIHKNEVDLHPCFQGFTHVYINNDLHILYPQTDDGQIIRKSLVDGTEAMVVEPREETTQILNQEADGNWRSKKIQEEEQLIEEVRKRPPLYDCRRPLAERALKARNKLWEEIIAAMNSTMDIASIKKNGNLCAMPTESIKISSTNRVAQREHEEAAGCTLSGCSLSTICSFKPRLQPIFRRPKVWKINVKNPMIVKTSFLVAALAVTAAVVDHVSVVSV
ncbi:uncharacterized protein LOC143907561 [Temnothorax americanus]|uniref:uncharacterized protein LOC143907561 n=1 Tax=Temnothorax americanus TaxID=1964332 RepID=UPI004067E739